jgi:processive 1,2-diacylglycerol beta-glucosyltransferase
MQVVPPRILLLHASAGAGHRRAADAVKTALLARNAVVESLDSMPLIHPFFRRIYVGGGLSLITRAPRVFGVLYRLTDRRAVDRLVRLPRYAAQRVSARRLMRVIRAFAPDAVVCTHFLPAELAASWRRRGKLPARLYIVITDFAPHRLWEHAGVDGYFVSSELAARRLIRDGISPEAVRVTGIPISLDFTRRFDKAVLRARFGLDLDRPVVIVTGGGLGAGSMASIAQEAVEQRAKAHFVFVTGDNTSLRERIERIVVGTGWRVLGYVANMPEWLAASDAAIGKAGGLTGSEMLAAGLPFIVPPGLHGHEDLNADYLQACGAAYIASTVHDAVETTLSIVGQDVRRWRMRSAARLAARPQAAHAIAASVLRDLERRVENWPGD